MMTRANAAPALEPSPEAVKAARERLREKGVGASDEIVRDALRSVLAIEGARLDRRAREAAAAVLLRIQEATREALAVMVQPNSPTTPAPFRAPQPEPRQAEPRRPVFKRPRGR
jgi:hypothetical protein